MNFSTEILREIELVLAKHLSKQTVCHSLVPVGGGCINQTYKVPTNVGTFFVKLNATQQAHANFDCEIKGLQLLGENCPLVVPETLGIFQFGRWSGLLLEYIESGHADHHFWQKFGSGLADLHQTTQAHFGLEFDNFIGSLPQQNLSTANWPDFFVESRLKPQLKLAFDAGALSVADCVSFEKLYPSLEQLIPEEPPALVHGDLWSGNFMTDQQGTPVLIDPAPYYGHREADIAFSQLFGGFDQAFYESYDEAWPLAPDFRERINIHNLYPLLVHVNLFGGGYVSQVRQIISKF